MTKIIEFHSRPELNAHENLTAFVEACKSELTVFGADLSFDEDTWDVTDTVRIKGHGAARHRLHFSRLGDFGYRSPKSMPEPFKSFAKAWLRYNYGVQPTKMIHRQLTALRILLAAFETRVEIPAPASLTSDDFHRAAAIAKSRYSPAAAFGQGHVLERLAKFLTEKGLSVAPIHWRSPLKNLRRESRVGAEFDALRTKRLPSNAALGALPQIYRSATEAKDLFVTSVVALLLSAPDRINEVLSLPADCEVEMPGKDGTPVYGIRWWPSKGAEPMVKWVVPSMRNVVREAISRIREITAPARVIAKWYEEHPDEVYLPEQFSHLRDQEWITMKELGWLMGAEDKTSPHCWRERYKLPTIVIKHRRMVRFSDVEKIIVGMKPKWFPYLNPDLGLRYSDALCIVRLHELTLSRGTYSCAIEPVTVNQINIPLGGCRGNRFRSIFDRHGYSEPDGSPIKVTTHQFRHYLNTLAQAGGLGEVDIAKWSGRKNIQQNEVYDHLSSDQMIAKVRNALGDSSQMLGPLGELPQNLPVSRDEFGRLRAPTAHTTDIGFCIHDYTMSPCQLHRDCLHCRDHVCVKGDAVKTQRMKDRLEEAKLLFARAEEASGEGYAGSERWLQHQKSTVNRLSQLVDFMTDPQVPVGAVIQLAPLPLPLASSTDERSSPPEMAEKSFKELT